MVKSDNELACLLSSYGRNTGSGPEHPGVWPEASYRRPPENQLRRNNRRTGAIFKGVVARGLFK